MKLLKGELQSQLLWCQRAQLGLLALLLFVSGAMYLFWLRPAITELQVTRTAYATARTELEQDQDRAKNLPRVDMEIQRLRQRVERFDKTLPRDEDLASFINDVTRVSLDASLKKPTWHLDSKPRRSQDLTELPIQFTFEGDFQSGVLKFLSGIEDMQRLTRVRKLDIKSTDAHDGQVKAEVTMNIYFGEE